MHTVCFNCFPTTTTTTAAAIAATTLSRLELEKLSRRWDWIFALYANNIKYINQRISIKMKCQAADTLPVTQSLSQSGSQSKVQRFDWRRMQFASMNNACKTVCQPLFSSIDNGNDCFCCCTKRNGSTMITAFVGFVVVALTCPTADFVYVSDHVHILSIRTAGRVWVRCSVTHNGGASSV